MERLKNVLLKERRFLRQATDCKSRTVMPKKRCPWAAAAAILAMCQGGAAYKSRPISYLVFCLKGSLSQLLAVSDAHHWPA